MNEKSVTDYWKDGFVKIFKYSGRASQGLRISGYKFF